MLKVSFVYLLLAAIFMSIQNISGKWTGVLVYGPKYREQSGKELYFDAELVQEHNLISGVAVDTGGAGVNPDKATIVGSLSSNNISFVKRYESLHYFTKGQHVVDRSRQGHDIYYSGMYDETVDAFKGNWEYRIKYRLFGLVPMRFIGGGTWTMSRK